jgi:two-component system LytT family sensor kinase
VRKWQALEIRVEDDGPGMKAANGAPSRGIGLANTRARLERLYGEGAQLTVENGPAGGVIATITLPYRPVEAHAAHSPVG